MNTRLERKQKKREPTVSLCMIVRNEEANLRACLESAAGLADETIIVDTGSTDKTKMIAESFATQVIDFVWRDDFSAARNASVEPATGQWIFWLDADDRLDEINRGRLLQLFNSLPQQPTAFLVGYSCLIDQVDQRRMRVDQARVFPNRPEMRWSHRVHEQILPAVLKAGGTYQKTDIIINHLGYQTADIRRRKDHRNLRLLTMEMGETPNDAFLHFYMGWTFFTIGKLADAIPHLEQSIKLTTIPKAQPPKLYSLLAQAYLAQDRPYDALTTCKAGRSLFATDPELCFTEANVYNKLGDFRRAAADYEELITMDPATTMAIGCDEGLTTYVARHHLAIVYRDQGRFADAETEWRYVLAERPDMRPALLGLAELVLVEERWHELEDLCRDLARLPGADIDSVVLIARAHLARNELPKARMLLEPIVAANPSLLWPHEILSRVLLQQKDWESAQVALEAILRHDPTHRAALANLERVKLIRARG